MRIQFSLAAMFAVMTGAGVAVGVGLRVFHVVRQIPTSDWLSWYGIGVLCACGIAVVAAILYRG